MEDIYLKKAVEEIRVIFETEIKRLVESYEYEKGAVGLWDSMGQDDNENIRNQKRADFDREFPTVNEYIEKKRKIKTIQDAYLVYKVAKNISEI